MTFVVAGRAHLFRNAEGGLAPAGEVVMASWARLPGLFPRVKLDEVVVMADHVHAILFLTDHPLDRARLGSIVRAWKASSTREIRRSVPTFKWQSHYQDWIIRSQSALNRIRRYIRGNRTTH